MFVQIRKPLIQFGVTRSILSVVALLALVSAAGLVSLGYGFWESFLVVAFFALIAFIIVHLAILGVAKPFGGMNPSRRDRATQRCVKCYFGTTVVALACCLAILVS